MNDADLGEQYERELARVVERVRTMPLTKLATCSNQLFELCGAFAEFAHESGSGLPDAQSLLRLSDHALPDQLQVLGDELAAVGNPIALERAYKLLVDMRKALP